MDKDVQADVEGEDRIDQSRLQRLLGYQITRAELHVHRKFVEHLESFSLRPVEFSILVLIDSNHGIMQRQIGDALGISPPNLVGVTTRLIKKRLVRRVRSRQDRRVQHLHLTQDGIELLAHAEALVGQFEGEIVAAIGPGNRSGLEKALQKILQL